MPIRSGKKMALTHSIPIQPMPYDLIYDRLVLEWLDAPGLNASWKTGKRENLPLEATRKQINRTTRNATKL